MTNRLEKSQKEWLAQRFDERVQFGVPLARHTSFKIGGPAEALIAPESPAELTALIKGAREHEISYRIIGGGTNLLVSDRGLSGLVILTTRCLEHILFVEETEDMVHISAGASVPLKRFCRYCLAQGLAGMNFAIGIPGTLGGAITMNAGTAGATVADVLSGLTLLSTTGEIQTVDRKRIHAAYRRLSWEPIENGGTETSPTVILGGEFMLTRADAASLRADARMRIRARKMTQPLGLPSAGCIFKNPTGSQPAGRLIELSGLKGVARGGAVISERHANFIVNMGGATATDVLALMGLIKDMVWNRFHIQLEPEVKFVGDEPDTEK